MGLKALERDIKFSFEAVKEDVNDLKRFKAQVSRDINKVFRQLDKKLANSFENVKTDVNTLFDFKEDYVQKDASEKKEFKKTLSDFDKNLGKIEKKYDEVVALRDDVKKQDKAKKDLDNDIKVLKTDVKKEFKKYVNLEMFDSELDAFDSEIGKFGTDIGKIKNVLSYFRNQVKDIDEFKLSHLKRVELDKAVRNANSQLESFRKELQQFDKDLETIDSLDYDLNNFKKNVALRFTQLKNDLAKTIAKRVTTKEFDSEMGLLDKDFADFQNQLLVLKQITKDFKAIKENSNNISKVNKNVNKLVQELDDARNVSDNESKDLRDVMQSEFKKLRLEIQNINTKAQKDVDARLAKIDAKLKQIEGDIDIYDDVDDDVSQLKKAAVTKNEFNSAIANIEKRLNQLKVLETGIKDSVSKKEFDSYNKKSSGSFVSKKELDKELDDEFQDIDATFAKLDSFVKDEIVKLSKRLAKLEDRGVNKMQFNSFEMREENKRKNFFDDVEQRLRTLNKEVDKLGKAVVAKKEFSDNLGEIKNDIKANRKAINEIDRLNRKIDTLKKENSKIELKIKNNGAVKKEASPKKGFFSRLGDFFLEEDEDAKKRQKLDDDKRKAEEKEALKKQKEEQIKQQLRLKAESKKQRELELKKKIEDSKQEKKRKDEERKAEIKRKAAEKKAEQKRLREEKKRQREQDAKRKKEEAAIKKRQAELKQKEERLRKQEEKKAKAVLKAAEKNKEPAQPKKRRGFFKAIGDFFTEEVEKEESSIKVSKRTYQKKKPEEKYFMRIDKPQPKKSQK